MKNKLVITADTLLDFSYSSKSIIVQQFRKEFPAGLDITGLWGTRPEAALVWHQLMAHPLSGSQLGAWAAEGILPARIWGDFGGKHLSRINLSGMILSGASLRHAELQHAVANGAYWNNVDACRLRAAALEAENIHIAGSLFRQAIFYRSNLCRAQCRHSTFEEARLQYVNFRYATFEYVSFRNADLAHTVFANTLLSCIDFRDANLHGAVFFDAVCDEVKHSGQPELVPYLERKEE